MSVRIIEGVNMPTSGIICPENSPALFNKGKGVFTGFCIIENIDKRYIVYNNLNLNYRLVKDLDFNALNKIIP